VIPYLVSSDLAVGHDRFLMTIIDGSNNILAAPDVGLDVRFFNLGQDPAAATASSAAVYMDSGNGNGLYRTTVDFPCWGDWGVEATVHQASGDSVARLVFDVNAHSSTPAIGDPAPHADTLTGTTPAEIADISTDPDPDPDFYAMTITQAVTSGKPALIIFATPAFCQTATCGPTLNQVKALWAPFKGSVIPVHVEPYLLTPTSSGLQPVLDSNGGLQSVPAVQAYGLTTEPYTFVIDASGNVAAKFDGMVGADELTAALDQVTGENLPPPSPTP
jgi:hypothetical protein